MCKETRTEVCIRALGAGSQIFWDLGALLYPNNKEVTGYNLNQVSLQFIRDHKG